MATVVEDALLSGAQMTRYARQLLLDEVGDAGQARIIAARVLVVGAGGLGVPAASYLAAAGVGRVALADGDRIELSNLPRQVAYADSDIGRAKTGCLRERMLANNPNVDVAEYSRLTPDNVMEIVARHEYVVDGCDNYPTRYLVNDACVRLGRPLISGALSHFSGQLAAFEPGGGCYRCAFPTPPDAQPSQGCVAGGVLGPVAGVLGCWMALETLKQILGLASRLRGEMLLFDGLGYGGRRISLRRRAACAACGGGIDD